MEIFPKADNGQFALRVRAPAGTRLERTVQRVQDVLSVIQREAGGAENVDVTIGLVGVHGSSYPVNLVHLWNGGPEEGWLAVQLDPKAGIRVADFTEHLRGVLAREMPDLRISFEPQDIVARVMSFGSPTPIEVAVSGPDLEVSRKYAESILAKLREVPYLRDVQIVQSLDYPTIAVDVDRERAGMLGVTEAAAARSLLAATSSSRFTAANYWADPRTGISYNLQVEIPQSETTSLEDVGNIPVDDVNGGTTLLRNVADLHETTSVGDYERYNMARVVSMTANLHDVDLGSAIRGVRAAIAGAGPAPDPRTRVDLRGQAVPLEQLLSGFERGLAIAVVVIFLLLAANFESLRLSLAVMSTIPAVLLGIALTLWVSGTTLNIESAIGGIMSIGVAVANAIMLVTFAERDRLGGASNRESAVSGALGRLRPILMTSMAMSAGMVPLALGLGAGGEQTSPLGRAVIGGLAFATVATLFVLPAVFAILARGSIHSNSLDPEDELSPLYDGSV